MAVATAKTQKSKRIRRDPATRIIDLIEAAPRIARFLKSDKATYMGPCVVQATGAWTRIGACWHVRDHGWLVAGPGVASWGTSEGLAELASGTAPNPSWHAWGVGLAPVPNLLFALEETTRENSSLGAVWRAIDGLEAARPEWTDAL